MISWRYVSLFSVLLYACAFGPAQGHFLGLGAGSRDCSIYRTSLKGTCQSIYDCPIILENIRRFTPTFCFFRGRIPYVCCPTLTSAITDVSPPSTSFTCGTSTSKLASRLAEEALILRALASPALASFLPRNLHSTLSAAHSTSVRSTLPSDRGWNFLITQGVDSFKNSWPWMALLGFGSKSSPRWRCDGVLVNELWVLTAAHCVVKEYASVVRLGEHNTKEDDESPHQDFEATKTVFHPNYNYPQGYHDLALLKLDRPVKIKKEIRPVCLPWGKKPIPSFGSTLRLAGWGRTSFGGNRSDVLQEASLHLLDTKECSKGYSTLADYRSTYPRGITSDLLCIGDEDGQGQDACQGDSGGPVVYRDGESYILAGIVSQGYGCSKENFPGLYASVHHAPDLAWIKRVAF